MTGARRLPSRLFFAVVALGSGGVLAQESEKDIVDAAAPDQAVCADPWYGGCPDSCTLSFRRLQNRGALSERALEDWADRCVKTEEQSQQQQPPQSQSQQQDQTAQTEEQSDSSGTEQVEPQSLAQAQRQQQTQEQAQAQQQAQSQPQRQQQSQQQTQEQAQAQEQSPSRPQQQAESQQQTAQGEQQQQGGESQSGQAQSRAQSRPQGQPQQTARADGAQQAEAETGSQQPGNAAGSPATPSQADRRGGGQADPAAGGRETAAETPAAAGREEASEEDTASLPQLAESRRAAAGPEDRGSQARQDGRGGGEAPEAAQQAARTGAHNERAGGGRTTGTSLMTPLPRGQGSTGRPFEPLERALDELGGRGFGLSERVGMACGLAAAPMCGGLCQAGVCAPAAEGGGCRCRPARTPETAEHRRRALCTLTGPSRLTVSVCRSPGSGASASCAMSSGADSRLCETLWSVPYREIGVLAGGRSDLDLRLDAVPLWDWARPGEAIDRVSVPLGRSGKSVDPKSVWESAEEPLPASDVRVLVGSKSTGEVAVLQRDPDGGLRETKTTLRTAQLVSGCDDTGDACPETQLARLRLTLFSQAPDTRLLATYARQGAEWWGECAAGTIQDRAQLLCYQLRTDGSGEARAWKPLRLDWLGDNASAEYAAALMEPEEERSALERAFFARAAATQGSAPALLLAFASQEAGQAYAQGGLPQAGGAAEGDLDGLLVLESDELTRLTPAGRSALARRSRNEIARAVGEAGQGGDGAGARLAAAAILDPDMIALTRRQEVGACLMRSRPEPALACFHETEDDSEASQPAVWDPLAWPGRGAQPRYDRESLLAAARAEGPRTGALGDPVLDLVLSAAVAPEGRGLRAFDVYRSPESGDAGNADSWRGLILAFKRGEGETAPLFAQCSEEALFLTERRRTPLAGTLRLLREGGAGCTAAFPDTYGTHREEIRRRLAERLPAGVESLALNTTRALLKTRSPAGASLIEVWSAAPGMDRDFPTVTAQCLMQRAEQAADLAPDREKPGQLGLEHALLTPDWRALGWRANPLGLMLRAESCEEGV